MVMIELETARLRLRQWKLDDFEWYAALCADPQVMRFLGGKTFNRLEAWRQFCSLAGHWHFRGYGLWAVEEKATGRLLGRVGLIDHEGWPGFEVGWTLAREAWGQGYATEAARRSMQYAFEDLKRDRVISLIDPENHPSRLVAERLGEAVQGTTELMGTNVLVYGIDRERWVARQF
jgi:RimJ/RimL family protein N-acetyltransferase